MHLRPSTVMLPRMLRLPVSMSRRSYSFFSSKPGGGRYFNSAKPHKVAPTSAGATASTAKPNAIPDDGSPSTSTSSPSPPSSSSADDAPSSPIAESDATQAASQPQPTLASSPADPHLPPHPTFSDHTYPLHQFLSLHRPLLLLPLATSTLFEPPATAFEEAISPSSSEIAAASRSFFEELSEPLADADADAARQLARALALNRVGGQVAWEQTLARLGDIDCLRLWRDSSVVENSKVGISMDSTKRKRRKKMSKHKYKKRRRSQRAERRRMGK